MPQPKNIRNYTSEADPAQSILTIEKLIIEAGARSINKVYDGFGNPSGIKFTLPVNNMQLTFDMEASVDLVYQYMLKNYVKAPTAAQQASCRKQAARTAWKNLMELLQIQLAMVEVRQVEMMQALFPLLSDGSKTYYQYLKEKEFKPMLQLTQPK